jgi:hypothetical protein
VQGFSRSLFCALLANAVGKCVVGCSVGDGTMVVFGKKSDSSDLV